MSKDGFPSAFAWFKSTPPWQQSIDNRQSTKLPGIVIQAYRLYTVYIGRPNMLDGIVIKTHIFSAAV